jgi:hypothetical protein
LPAPAEQESADDADVNPRLVCALEEYQAEVDQGRQPDRQRLLTKYADVAGDLQRCLDGLNFVRAARPRLESQDAANRPHPAQPATPLGDFQIVRELGRGGMGIVYEAVQLSLGRRVALKVLPFAAAYDARQLQRFRTEAHAAAQLHHTHIVPVFAFGQDRGVHYYAMQLIDGLSLATLIDHLRAQRQPSQATGEPALASSTCALALSTQRSTRPGDYYRTIARLIHQAATALEHAHQFGIVHRDVKPANLLVQQPVPGADPSTLRLWITDFGLAQVHSDAALTQTGDVMGTLRYMSPEQAGGQRHLIDQRTDVYSLGATLYELATLEPIFEGRDRQALLHQILLAEPRPPRKVAEAVPVELETIIVKATDKNTQDRYPTAQALADDLQRFLDHKPILARRPTLVDRARKWSRRHPSVVGAIVVLLLLVIAGLLVNNRMIATEQAKTAQRAREAEEQFQLARRAADEMIEIAEQELAEDPVQENLRKRLLETALEYYQEFSRRHGEDPSAPELAATRDRVKKILDDLAVMQGERRVHLLRETAVLNDMKLVGAKRDQVVALSRRLEEQRQATFRESAQLPPDERRQRFLAQARSSEAEVAELLGPELMQRLRQIALQCQGTKGLREPAVAALLKLTPEQKDRIREIEMEAFFGRPGGPEGRPLEPFEERLKVAIARITQTVLTQEQARQWRGMVGEPYQGPLPFFFRGPPPPGGPGGRNGHRPPGGR